MGGELQLTLLGKLQASRDGAPVTGFVHKKSLALLYYLAVTGRPHSREALAGLLWGEATEANARAGLRKVLADLRRRLASHLTITRQQVAFNRECPYWLDVEAFNRRIGETIGQRDNPLTDEVVAALTKAVELYQGDFLEGFYVLHAPLFEEWVLLERERLRLSALRALHTLAAHYAAKGAYARAIDYTARLLALEPWQEEAHRQMMFLLALSGQQGAALRQYEICRRVLTEELGVEPEAETTALYSSIRAGTESHARFLVPPHNLPAPLTLLIGREAELVEIEGLLQDPACRLLTLVGPGGSGKTRLALEAAAAQLGHFEHGVYLVSLAPLDSVQSIVPTVARALGFSFYQGSEPRQQLLDFVRQKSMLLILDNFEHLLPGVGLVTDLLETAPGLKILTTSRTRLNVQGEHLFPIAGMDYPALEARAALTSGPSPVFVREEPRDATQYSAVQLFLTSARRVRPHLELTADDLMDVVHICRLVQGMPLAILLAAAWVKMLTPAEIAAQICGQVPGQTGQGIDFLETDWRDVPARQRSMRAVFDHSWNLLTELEQEVFAELSVFRGGFTREAARQVSGASLRDLMALMDKSLLQRSPSGRYEMHELLRHYAAEKLDQVLSASAAAHDQHCAYYIAALQGWAVDLHGAQQQEALAEMGAESENVRAAWNWAAERGPIGRLDQAMEGLCLFYKRRGRYQEGETACRTAAERLSVAEALPRGASGDGLRVLAKTLAWQGVFNRLLRRTEVANQLLRQSLTFLEEPALADQEPVLSLSKDTWPEKAFALWQMGDIVFDSDREQAGRLYEQSLALYRSLGDRWGTANVLDALGWVTRYLGDYGQAQRLHQESLVLRRALGDQRGISRSLRGLSFIALRQGQLEEAERLIRESSAILQETGNQADIAERLGSLGWILVILGKFAEGCSRIEESVAIWNDLGLCNSVAYASIPLGSAKMHLGLYEQARALAQKGLIVAREVGDRGRMGFALCVLGQIALAVEGYAEAQGLLQESATVYHEIGQREEVGCAIAVLGYVIRGLGQFSQAWGHIHEALRVATEIRFFLPLVLALPAIALLLADQGEPERAVELYALASRHPFVANSHWFEDIAGRHIAAVAATLPPDVVTAAQARGQAWDLWGTAVELLAELGG